MTGVSDGYTAIVGARVDRRCHCTGETQAVDLQPAPHWVTAVCAVSQVSSGGSVQVTLQMCNGGDPTPGCELGQPHHLASAVGGGSAAGDCSGADGDYEQGAVVVDGHSHGVDRCVRGRDRVTGFSRKGMPAARR
jgi:hypothetical protein